MATSQKTSTLATGQDAASQEANLKYEDALAKLTAALDSRQNRTFDPTMLAAAQGFLTPSRSGSFGESLGNVAGLVGKAQQAQSLEDQDIARQRLELAGMGVQRQQSIANLGSIDEYIRNKRAEESGQAPLTPTEPLAPPPPPSLDAGALAAPDLKQPVAGPVASPVAAVAPAISSPINPIVQPTSNVDAVPPPSSVVPPVQPISFDNRKKAEAPTVVKAPAKIPSYTDGIQIMPQNKDLQSGVDFMALNRNSNKSFAELIKEANEIDRKNLVDTPASTLNLKSGKVFIKPSGKQVEAYVSGYGNMSMDENIAAFLSNLKATNQPESYKAVADNYFKGSPDASGKVIPQMSVSDQKLKESGKEELQKADIAMEVESRKDFRARSRDASETLTTANQMREFSKDPNAKNMTGILANQDISSAVALLVKDGIGSRNFSVGIPQIEDIMRNAKLSREDQAKYKTFLMLSTQMRLQSAKYMKGSVSDAEQRMLADSVIGPNDTPEAIRMKADVLTRRAQFDRQTAKDWKASKLPAEEYLDSDRYQKREDSYTKEISKISTGQTKLVERPAAAAASTSGLIRDSVTGKLRRKKEGE